MTFLFSHQMTPTWKPIHFFFSSGFRKLLEGKSNILSWWGDRRGADMPTGRGSWEKPQTGRAWLTLTPEVKAGGSATERCFQATLRPSQSFSGNISEILYAVKHWSSFYCLLFCFALWDIKCILALSYIWLICLKVTVYNWVELKSIFRLYNEENNIFSACECAMANKITHDGKSGYRWDRISTGTKA